LKKLKVYIKFKVDPSNYCYYFFLPKTESGKLLHDRVISLRRTVLAYKYKPIHLCFV